MPAALNMQLGQNSNFNQEKKSVLTTYDLIHLDMLSVCLDTLDEVLHHLVIHLIAQNCIVLNILSLSNGHKLILN